MVVPHCLTFCCSKELSDAKSFKMRVPFGNIVEQDNSWGPHVSFLCMSFRYFKEKIFMNGNFSCVIFNSVSIDMETAVSSHPGFLTNKT